VAGQQPRVTGIAENTTPDPTCPDAEPEGKPVIWEGDEIRELPTVFGDLDGATQASNDRGQIVGATGNCIAGVPFTSLHAVLWERHGHRWMASDLGTLGGKILNLAFDINNRGQVVGQSDLPGDTAFHAFLRQHGIMNDLGTLPGDVVSWAETINNRGEAVGTSCDANNNMHPFIWQNGTMTDLKTVMSPDSPWVLLEALGNNDRGQIVGFAFNTVSGEVHGYVLTPVSGEDDSAPSASGSVSQSSANERPPVVLPENIREMLQRRMALRHGWLGYIAPY
jgi:probable HAF family extracellular repeat protein